MFECVGVCDGVLVFVGVCVLVFVLCVCVVAVCDGVLVLVCLCPVFLFV